MDHRKGTKFEETFKKSLGCGDSFLSTSAADRSLFGGKFIKIPSVQTDLRSVTRRASIRKTKSCLNIALKEPKFCKLKRSLSSDDITVLFSFSDFYGRRRGGVQHGDLSRTLVDLLRETRDMQLSSAALLSVTLEEEVAAPVAPLARSPSPLTPSLGQDGGGIVADRVANNPCKSTSTKLAKPSEHRASLRAALLLTLSAWRTCRVQEAESQKRNEELQNQVSNLSRQISLLRQLNTAESQRAASATAELIRSRSLIQCAQNKLEEFKQEQEKAKEESGRRERRLEEQTIVAENLRNDLIAVKQDLAALESQLSREREKLAKEREEKKMLLEKAEKSEAAEAAAIRLFESVCNESRSRDEELKAIQILLEEALTEKKQLTIQLSESEEKYAEAQVMLMKHKEQKSSLEERLAKGESTAAHLRRILQLHVEEVGVLRSQIEALNREAETSRVGTLCISLLRVPLAFLQALHFISSPFNRTSN